MARIFPEKIIRASPFEVARVFRSLKRLPGEWNIWLNLVLLDSESPDFLLIDQDNRALVLKVSSATQQEIRQAPQLTLLNERPNEGLPGELEKQIIEKFLRELEQHGFPIRSIGKAVIFPNIKEDELQALFSRQEETDIAWLSREWLSEKKADDWSSLFGSSELGEDQLRILRGKVSPECRIPVGFTSKIHARNIGASLGDYLLDYDQEYVLKTDLDLEAAGEQVSRDFRVQVVNGVAGSGKTLVLLYRLRLLKFFFPRKRFLVLTHNRPLIREMRSRYELLAGNSNGQIRWQTFMGWCRSNWLEEPPWNDPISPPRRNSLLRQIWEEYLAGTGVSVRIFDSELAWVKDSGFRSGMEYLEANRKGRGFRLTMAQRNEIARGIHNYQQLLKKNNEMDWWDVPKNILDWIREGSIKPMQYDVILVDEAQFFAGSWFDILHFLVVPKVGYLFLAADPSQGFLRRGDSWKSISGLEVRGRTHLLTRSYRTTRAILDFAVRFYRLRLPNESADFLSPDFDLMEKGIKPKIIRLPSPQDERARIVNEIISSVEKNLPLKHILVLHASLKGANLLTEALRSKLGEDKVIDPKERPPGDCIRITTINAGTGLECPIVFIAGTHELFEKEDSLKLGEEEREELIMEHTKKLYMALTRSGQRLVLTYVGDLPKSLIELASREFVTIEE